MQDRFQKILNESKVLPDNNLVDVIFAKLQKRIRFVRQIRLSMYSLGTIIFVIALFISVKSLYVDLYNSSLFDYVYLIFSEDLNTLAFISKEILYAFLESIPLVSLMLSLGVLFMFAVLFNGILLSFRKEMFPFLKIN